MPNNVESYDMFVLVASLYKIGGLSLFDPISSFMLIYKCMHLLICSRTPVGMYAKLVK